MSTQQKGTAVLSKSQRKEFNEFRKKHHKAIKEQQLTVNAMVQIWRDGYICGAVHGYDYGCKVRKHRRGGL